MFRINRHITITLVLSFLFSLALVLFRVLNWNRASFMFLPWNLGLAVIPLLLSVLALRMGKTWLLLPVLALWLLFFPNAPYIVTDFFHLKPRYPVPFWYDLVLLMSFAWNGLVCAFLSLGLVHGILKRTWGSWPANSLAMLAIFLSGFGVYLGRFLRWNSWDVLTNPTGLLSDISQRVLHPMQHSKTWAFTIAFSALFSLMCMALQAIRNGERIASAQNRN